MKKIGLAILNVLFFGLSITAGVTLVRQSQEVRSQAQTEPSLEIKVDATDIIVGQHIGVIVEINSLQKPIGFADLSLAFDPTALEIINVGPGQFFKNPKIITDNQSQPAGRIHYITSKGDGETLSTGKGNLMIVIFKTKKAGPTEVKLSEHTVSLNETSPNTIKSPAPLIISIKPR